MSAADAGGRQSASRARRDSTPKVDDVVDAMKRSAVPSWLLLVLLLVALLAERPLVGGAAVGKSGTASGGRGVKGLRHKAGTMRRPGDRRPVMTSAGIRAGANTVMVEPPASHSSVGVGGNAPPGSGVRRPDEAERYYNSPHGAKVVDASHFESEYILGRKLAFYCMAEGVPRPHITWLKDGIELYAHPFFQVHEYRVGKNRIKSKMEIDPATQKDAGFYECQADNKYAIDRRGFRTDYTLDVY